MHLQRKIVEFAHVIPFDRYWVTADLPDLQDWPDAPTGRWIKVQGKLYESRDNDGNYSEVASAKRMGRLKL